MVVVLDLDEEPSDHAAHNGIPYHRTGLQLNGFQLRSSDKNDKPDTAEDAVQQRDPNLGGFSAALACYP